MASEIVHFPNPAPKPPQIDVAIGLNIDDWRLIQNVGGRAGRRPRIVADTMGLAVDQSSGLGLRAVDHDRLPRNSLRAAVTRLIEYSDRNRDRFVNSIS